MNPSPSPMVLWQLTLHGKDAQCVINPVSQGLEMQVLFGGTLLYSHRFDRKDELLASACNRRLQMQAQGWRPVGMRDIDMMAAAMAVDEITYGHLRRVQVHAIRLARALGVEDEAALEAIDTAALLHDVGKLAVPNHILNKPGKLTPVEFGMMKRHVELGVNMLAGLALTCPVAPIVLCHHENWDGTGYPMGLSGSEIPLGARVLAVVDCFDALTSDRPYRSRMSANAALQVLLEHSGTKYDPVAVDTFMRMCLDAGATADAMRIH